MNRIKVLYLITRLELSGRIEKNVYNLLKKLIKDNYKIFITYWKKKCDFYVSKLQELGIKVILIDYYVLSFRYFSELNNMIKTNNFHIIRSWFYDEDLMLFLSRLFLNHNYRFLASLEAPFFEKKLHFLRYKIIDRYFDKIICFSECYRNLVFVDVGWIVIKLLPFITGLKIINLMRLKWIN